MSSRRRNIGRSALLAVALGLIVPFIGAAPAQATASCWGAGTDGSVATASCSGVGNARVNVTCNALWPFTPWADYGGWYYVNGGATIVNSHAYCAGSTMVWVQYG